MAADLIKEKTNMSEVGGLTSYSTLFRDELRRSAFVPEQDAIPKQEKVKEPKKCSQLHPGLCPHIDGDDFPILQLAAIHLLNYLLTLPLFSYVKLACETSTSTHAVYFVVAYVRYSQPRLSVVIHHKEVRRDAGLHLDADLDKGGRT
jgi:hypothetical protein